MFVVAFALALITANLAVEIPSYIHVCGRRDPNLDQCILNNIENLRDKICNGFPELNTQSINPFIIDQLTVFNTSNSKLYLQDVKVMGLCDFVLNSLHIDIDKLHFDIDLSFKQIRIDSTYNINLHLLVPIANNAQIYTTTDNVRAKARIDIQLTTQNEKKIYVFVKVDAKS